MSDKISVFADIKDFFSQDPSLIAMFFLKALLIFLACIIVKRIVMMSFGKVMGRTRMEKGLQNFLKSILNVLLWFLLVIIVTASLDIPTNPLVAAFGVIGLAISLSVQGTLSNLAGGVNILASKAFVVGDYIEIGDDAGFVHDIGMVHTGLTTFDNRRILVPNSTVMSVRVINYSVEEKRRVQHKFTASYDAPIEQVQTVIRDMVAEHSKVLQDPAPVVRLENYGDSAIEYVLRAWCLQDDYWDVYYDLLEKIKPTLDANDISIPYPHMNVHIMKENS